MKLIKSLLMEEREVVIWFSWTWGGRRKVTASLDDPVISVAKANGFEELPGRTILFGCKGKLLNRNLSLGGNDVKSGDRIYAMSRRNSDCGVRCRSQRCPSLPKVRTTVISPIPELSSIGHELARLTDISYAGWENVQMFPLILNDAFAATEHETAFYEEKSKTVIDYPVKISDEPIPFPLGRFLIGGRDLLTET
jgi:hypothetical protein